MGSIGCGDGGDLFPLDGGRGDASVVDGSVSIDGAVGDGAAPDGTAAACLTTGACDPVDSSGCSDGKDCVLVASDPECSGLVGSGGDGETCASVTDCGPGLACFLTRAGDGECGRICCADDAVCGSGGRCGAGRLADGAATAWGRCLPKAGTCDLLDPIQSCEPAEGCYVVSAAGDTACRPAGSRDVAEACQEQNDCAPGLACWGFTGPTCRRICATDPATGSCPAGEGECVHPSLWPAGTGVCTVSTAARLN